MLATGAASDSGKQSEGHWILSSELNTKHPAQRQENGGDRAVAPSSNAQEMESSKGDDWHAIERVARHAEQASVVHLRCDSANSPTEYLKACIPHRAGWAVWWAVPTVNGEDRA